MPYPPNVLLPRTWAQRTDPKKILAYNRGPVALSVTATDTVGPAIDYPSGATIPLTLYNSGVADGVLTTAQDLTEIFPAPPLAFVASKVGTTAVNYWVELWTQGNASILTQADPSPGEFTPSGHGFLFVARNLAGARFKAGTWTFTQRLAVNTAGASATADIHFRAFKLNGGTYTAICEGTLAAQSIVTAGSVFTITATSVPETAFVAGDQLYIDVQLRVTATTNFAAGTSFQLLQPLANAANYATPGFTYDRDLQLFRPISDTVGPALDASPSQASTYFRIFTDTVGPAADAAPTGSHGQMVAVVENLGAAAVEGTWGLLDISGNGVISPPTPGTLSASGTGSALVAGSYTYTYTWIRPGSYETGASGTKQITGVTAGQNVHFPAINNIPSGVTSVRVYCTATTGTGMHTGFCAAFTPSGGSVTPVISVDGDGTALPLAGGTVILQPNTAWTDFLAGCSPVGMCVRVGWNILSTDGINYDFSILKPFTDTCVTNGCNFALRIMAGQWTPSGYFSGGGNAYAGAANGSGNWLNPGDTHQGGTGAAQEPYPWEHTPTAGAPNAAFESIYQNYANAAQTFALAQGTSPTVPLLHFATYGQNFSELYFGSLVKTGDYTYARFITGHERLMAIAYGIASSTLAVEFPLSGTGTLWHSGATQVDTDLSAYAASLTSGNPGTFFLQLNGFGPSPAPNVATDAVTNTSTKDVTSAGNHFAGVAAGDNIQIPGAGTGGSTLTTTVATFVNNGHITTTAQAGTAGTFTATSGKGNNPDGSWVSVVQYAGQANEQNDEDMQAQTYVSGVGHACQMIGTSNTYSWNTLYTAIKNGSNGVGPYDIKYIEVYVNSAVGGTSTALFNNVASFNPTGFGVTDQVVIAKPPLGRSVTDSVGPPDDEVTTASVYARATSESQTTTDSLAAAQALIRAPSETVGPALDAAPAIIGKKSVTDTVGPATDTAARALVALRTASESNTVSDAVARVATLLRAISETVGPAADAIARFFQGARSATDTVGPATDTAVRGPAKSVSEAVGPATDSVARGPIKVLTDTVGPAADAAPVRALAATRPVSESNTTTDTVARQGFFARLMADTVGPAVDAVLRAAATARSATDTVGPAADAAPVRAATSRRNPTETVGPAADGVARQGFFSRVTSDTVGPALDAVIGRWQSGTKIFEFVIARVRNGKTIARVRSATVFSYASAVLARTPAAYWRLNDSTPTAADQTGNGHIGVLHGGITPGVLSPIGDGSPAMVFDGTSGYIRVPYAAALNPAAFAVQAWVRPDSVPSVNTFAVDCRPATSGGSAAGFGLAGASSNGGFFLVITAPSGQTFCGTAASYYQTGKWYHLVGVYDGTQARLYVNGVLAAGPTTGSYVQNPTIDTTIGAFNVGGSNWFKGGLDEIAIFGVALTAAQVLNLYYAGLAPRLIATTLAHVRDGLATLRIR